MIQNRVVITGIGSVSGLGLNSNEMWNAIVSGQSAIGPMSALAQDQIRCRNGVEIRNFRPENHFSKVEQAMTVRCSQLTIVAAREAMASAGQSFRDRSTQDPFQTALIFGAPITLGADEEELFRRFYAEGKVRVDPFTLIRNMRSAPINSISTEFGLFGPGFMIDSACSGALQAVGEAFELIRSGRAKRALAGGGDSSLGLTHWKAWEQIGALATDTCRPFSKERGGTILGEGAAVFALENLSDAVARGATIFGEVLGFAATRDGGDVTKPSRERIGNTMRMAIEQAKCTPNDIDYINAHGSGTKLNDLVETQAIKDIFGLRAYEIPVSATKAAHGHLESAAGAIELAIATLAMRNGILPPTLNFLTPDPDCDLDYVPNIPRHMKIRSFLKNSFGFGGANASLVVTALS